MDLTEEIQQAVLKEMIVKIGKNQNQIYFLTFWPIELAMRDKNSGFSHLITFHKENAVDSFCSEGSCL